MKIISLFSGAGGLDTGFEQEGFNVIWANDNWRGCHSTYLANHPGTTLNPLSLTDIVNDESHYHLPTQKVDGIIGGSPCQSWSLAARNRGKGIKDKRGQLFYDYAAVIQKIQPKFFVAENVAGIISSRNIRDFVKLIMFLEKIEPGYWVKAKCLNASDYGVPQERKRVVIVGYRKDAFEESFDFNSIKTKDKVALSGIIRDLGYGSSVGVIGKNGQCAPTEILQNHEHLVASFSSHYMSRNRKRNWNETSYTIQASGRHIPLHPDSCSMIKLDKDKWKFENEDFRRLSVRECARIQTFPDDYVFNYKNILDGYKMVGNAVPVKMARAIAEAIKKDFK